MTDTEITITATDLPPVWLIPKWTEEERAAISRMASEQQLSQRHIIRNAVRLYQAVHAGACTVHWLATPGGPLKQ